MLSFNNQLLNKNWSFDQNFQKSRFYEGRKAKEQQISQKYLSIKISSNNGFKTIQNRL